jgi:hypothetical protein
MQYFSTLKVPGSYLIAEISRRDKYFGLFFLQLEI